MRPIKLLSPILTPTMFLFIRAFKKKKTCIPYIFTDLALWAGSVIESTCPCVCCVFMLSYPGHPICFEDLFLSTSLPPSLTHSLPLPPIPPLPLPVMSEYHKMDTNEYLNIFGCQIMYQANI